MKKITCIMLICSILTAGISVFAEFDTADITEEQENVQINSEEVLIGEVEDEQPVTAAVDDSLIAEDVKISGITRPGYTLTADYSLTGECDDTLTIIEWYIGSETEPAATGAEYTMKNADGNKTVKVAVTPVGMDGNTGKKVYSETAEISAALNQCPSAGKISDYSVNADSNPDYVFKENGYTYVMLEAEDEGLYVCGNDVFGGIKLPVSPTHNYFDPDDETTIAYWLNNNYINGEAPKGTKINEHVVDYLKERDYLTEGNGVKNSPIENDYVVRCKIALPAFYEYTEQYSDIIGYRPVKSSYSAFRSPRSGSNVIIVNLALAASDGTNAINGTNVSKADTNYVNLNSNRACMLIGYDFFKTYKLESDMGIKVKEALRSKFTKKEMSELYSEEELTQMGYGSETAEIKTAALTGIRAVGQNLTFECELSPQNADADIAYEWYWSDEKDGVFKRIDNADKKSYVVDQKYENKFIKVKANIYNTFTKEKYGEFEYITEEIGSRKPITAVPSDKTENISGGKRASVKVTNRTGNDAVIYMVFAAFDENNVMTSCNAYEETVSAGEDNYYIDTDDSDAAFYKLMVWESETSAKPLCGITIKGNDYE